VVKLIQDVPIVSYESVTQNRLSAFIAGISALSAALSPVPAHALESSADFSKQAQETLQARGVEYAKVDRNISRVLHSNQGAYRLYKLGELTPGLVEKADWQNVIMGMKGNPSLWDRFLGLNPDATEPNLDDPSALSGQANLFDAIDSEGAKACGVITNLPVKQAAYDYMADVRPVIFPTNLTNFMLESHEMTHCMYQPKELGVGVTKEKALNPDYVDSVRETAGDLGTALFYAKKTGSFSIYNDLIKPYRVSRMDDPGHTTAWSLETILKDIDSAAVQRMDVQDIPGFLQQTMAKHFEKDGRLLNPKLGEPVTSAMQAIVDELHAKADLIEQMPSELASRIEQDISHSLEHNYSSFYGLLLGVQKHALIDNLDSYLDKYRGLSIKQIDELESTPVIDRPMPSPIDELRGPSL
jgi:hypothetical protein